MKKSRWEFDNSTNKRHRCYKCKHVRAESQMHATARVTKNRRDQKWKCNKPCKKPDKNN